MEFLKSSKICVALVTFILLCSSMCWGDCDWSVLLFDDFDDGDYDGWSVTDHIGNPAEEPNVVPSPEGYSLRGVGSGYSQTPGLNVQISRPLLLSNVSELKIEMRAKSGPEWPNQAQVTLFNGDDFYRVVDYGESNQWAQFHSCINSQNYWYNHPINANVWHDFAWTRDCDGWWSLSIDGQEEAPNFHQDNQLTSFDTITIVLLRNQSEIEWIRISGVTGLRVLSPNGGENWVAETTENIQWEACCDANIAEVKIEYSDSNGQSWNLIDSNTTNDGQYEWLAPEVTSNQCLIRISDTNDPNIHDTSDDVFTIFECQIALRADLYRDCRVDSHDLAVLADEWLRNGNPFGVGCALWEADEDTVALWHLNGNGNDDSGNGNHLQVHPTNPAIVTWDYAKYCFGAVMGEDDWSGGCGNSTGAALREVGSGCTYPGSGDWTVEAWICFPSNSEGYYAVSHYSEHVEGHDPYHLYVSNGEAFFQLADESHNVIVISDDVSAYVGQWVHLAGVYRYQQDVALYLNGNQVAYDTTTLIPEYLPSYGVCVGGNYCTTSTGLKVDEVRISDIARYTHP